ncbi:MAG: hypothetical protein IJK46_04695 [Prevotella sp.]|nr:hypothetical protein [Prevotella sp.]
MNSIIGQLLSLKRQYTNECYKARQCPDSWLFHRISIKSSSTVFRETGKNNSERQVF